MTVSLIVAVAENGAIGRDNELPWRLPADLRYFKATTLGSPVIMGRRTYESIGHPLPGRRNVVLSRDPQLRIEGVEVVHSLPAALEAVADAEEAFVIGGATVFDEALSLADRVYVTRVHARIPGDTYFPDLEPHRFRRRSSQRYEPDELNALPYSFEVWERIPPRTAEPPACS